MSISSKVGKLTSVGMILILIVSLSPSVWNNEEELNKDISNTMPDTDVVDRIYDSMDKTIGLSPGNSEPAVLAQPNIENTPSKEMDSDESDPDMNRISSESPFTSEKPPKMDVYQSIEGVQTAVNPSFNDYLDNYDLNFSTGGDASWFGQNTTTHDGYDAMQSGNIDDSQSTWLRTYLQGTGNLSFYWKSSSEYGYDELILWIDGYYVDSITGNSGWEFFSYHITTSGNHTVEWEYDKDGSISSYDDTSWLDEVSWVPDDDYIGVVSPTSNTKWAKNSTYDILMDIRGNIENVTIELYNNDLFEQTLAESTYSASSFTWRVPVLPSGTKYQIKVSSFSNASFFNFSDYFTITIENITVLTPHANTAWEVGDYVDILWDSIGSNYLAIELYKDDLFNRTITSLTSNDGSLTFFKVPFLEADTTYQIKITSTVNTSIYDFSDYFSVKEITINVTSPSEGDTWEISKYYYIYWDETGGSSVTIEFYNGTVLVDTLSTNVYNDGSYLYTVPSDTQPGSNYRFRIISNDNSSVFDYSDYFRIIEERTITVESPSSTSKWVNGETYTIRWSTTSYIGDVTIELYQSYSLNATLATNTTNDGELLWTPNLDLGTSYRIKIYASNLTTVYDYSDYFSIVYPLSINTPRVITEWTNGTVENISWNYYSSHEWVGIELYQNGTLTYDINGSTENDGSFSWRVPSVINYGDDYQIRIYLLDDPSISVMSSFFMIHNITINDALDNYFLEFTTGGENLADWYIEYNETYDGQDSMATRLVGDMEYTTIEATVFGAVTVSFYWKVSSEYFYDELFFRVDGSSVGEISGEVNWTLFSYTITTSGFHTLQWQYYKHNSYTAEGLDKAWIDQITLNQTNPSLEILEPKTGDQLRQNTPHTISWNANGTFKTVSFELWKGGFYGLTIIDETDNDGSFEWYIPYGLPAGSDYQVKIIATYDNSVYDFSGNFTLLHFIFFNDAVDNDNLQFYTSYYHPWYGQNQTTFDGVDAAQGFDIGNHETTFFYTTINGSGTLSFYYRVSSELYYDYFLFIINDEIVTYDSGASGWKQLTVDLDVGNYTIIWAYDKDGAVSSNLDTAFVDMITWIPSSVELDALPSTTLELGNTYQISWSTKGFVDYIGIDLYLNGQPNTVLAANTSNDGIFSWTLEDTIIAATGYSIRVVFLANTTVSDFSELFEIVSPSTDTTSTSSVSSSISNEPTTSTTSPVTETSPTTDTVDTTTSSDQTTSKSEISSSEGTESSDADILSYPYLLVLTSLLIVVWRRRKR